VTTPRDGREPGPLGEEAAKLIEAAQDWFHRTLADPSTARIATGSAECAWCPVCQLISVLRGERPDLTERLNEVQTAVSGLLRSLAEAATSSTAGGSPAAGRSAPAEQSRVHKIDLGEDPSADPRRRDGSDESDWDGE
jgi:hypothetical protein